MEIKTNFNLGDEVWYQENGIPTQGAVEEVHIIVCEFGVMEYLLLAKNKDEEYPSLTQASMFYHTKEELIDNYGNR